MKSMLNNIKERLSGKRTDRKTMVDPILVNMVEDELTHMHLSGIYLSTSLVTGKIRVDKVELSPNDGFKGSSVNLASDEDGDIRIYPGGTTKGVEPISAYTWISHAKLEEDDLDDV